MATDIILRSVKAAALTHAEMDQNWQSLASTVDIHSASATLAITDQNKIIETNIASGTMTLPTVANATGTDTDSFKITIKNINATSVIVDGNGAELIEGAASVTLLQYEAAEFTLDGAGTGWVVASYYGPNLVGITSTPTEINKLDGFTGVVADLNIISGGNAAGVSPTEFQYLNGVTSAIQTQLDARLFASNNLSDLANAGTSRSNLGVDAAGTDNSTDVTLAGTLDYLTIVGQAITRGAIVLTTDVSGTLPIANGGTAATTAAGARTALDVDAAGTDNSTDVSIAAGKNYVTIAGQILTLGNVDLTTDVTGALPYANMAFSNNIVAGDIATDAIGQAEIAASAVGQGELKTATQTSTINTAPTQRTLTGGVYTLWAQGKVDTSTGYSGVFVLGDFDGGGAGSRNDIRNTTITYVSTMMWGQLAGSSNATAQFEYITASKPYDLGDGEIPLFIFLEIDNATGDVIGVDVAEDPPWAYNGNTNTRPDFYKKENGVLVPYKKKLDIDICMNDCIESPENMERYLDFLKSPKYIEYEITQEIKHKDRFDVPHNLSHCDPNHLKGKSVVLVDPVSKLGEQLLTLHLAGESVGNLFISNKHIVVGNDEIKRCGSDCNHIVDVKWAHHNVR